VGPPDPIFLQLVKSKIYYVTAISDGGRVPTECPLFSSSADTGLEPALSSRAVASRSAALLALLQEMRVDVKGDRRIGMTEPMLDLGNGAPAAIRAEAQL
jgi:hypothetical protein